jgi:hypothetical protein
MGDDEHFLGGVLIFTIRVLLLHRAVVKLVEDGAFAVLGRVCLEVKWEREIRRS